MTDEKKVHILSRDVKYEGVFRMVRYHLRFALFNGGTSETVMREIVEKKPAVAILPYDPLTEKVILIEQFRAGALNHPKGPWLLEIVAGLVDTEETPEAIAKREAKEEAGCEILDLCPICEYFVSPGGGNEYLWLFCGRIDASNAGGIFGLHTEHEDIRAFALPLEEALQWQQEGKINTPPAIISLLWLQLNREKLKQLWRTK